MKFEGEIDIQKKAGLFRRIPYQKEEKKRA